MIAMLATERVKTDKRDSVKHTRHAPAADS
jgi:hypothetical protein